MRADPNRRRQGLEHRWSSFRDHSEVHLEVYVSDEQKKHMHSYTYPTVELKGGYRHFIVLFMIFCRILIFIPLPRSRAASSNQEV
jgi:hypothetical protein